MLQDLRTRDLALLDARLGNRPGRLRAMTEFRSVGHFTGIRYDGQRAAILGFGIKSVSRVNIESAVQLSFKRDQRHFKAGGELVLQLFALALVATRGLNL